MAAHRVNMAPSGATRRFAPELRFILATARGVGGAPMTGCDRRVLDWGIVIRGLVRHGLVAMVTPILLADRTLPAAAAAGLRAASSADGVATLMRVREALRIARALDAREIRFLVIKGAPLSVQLYASATARGGRDVDILIEPGKLVAAARTLAELGYVPPLHVGPAPHPDGPAPKETGFVHADSRILVELHARLADNDHLLPWDFETLWAARDTVAIGGDRIAAMGRTHLPLYLALHGAKHGWARLMWLRDLIVLLDTPEAIDRARADAAAIGLEGMMLHTLWAMHHWLGHPVAPALLARGAARRDVRLLNRLAARFHRDPAWYDQAPRRSWRRFVEGSLWSRAIGYAIKPQGWRRQLAFDLISPADRQIVALPARLDWLYVVVRPVGWLLRRVRQARENP